MNVKEFALEVMKNGGKNFRSFDEMRGIFQEYSANEDKIQTAMDAIQATLINLRNYGKMIEVEKMQEPSSDLRLMVLHEREQDELELLGCFQEDVTDLLLSQQLIRTTVDFILENYIDDSEEADDEEIEAEIPETDNTPDWESVDENGNVLLYELQFNPNISDYLQSSLSGYLDMCTQMYLEEMVKKAKTKEAEEVDPLLDTLFGSGLGTFSGELVISDEDLEDKEEDYEEPVGDYYAEEIDDDEDKEYPMENTNNTQED